MIPVQKTVTGTGTSTPFIPDIFQNPFNIGIGVSLQTGGLTTAIVSIEHCLDYSAVMSPTWNGSTGVTWFQNSGINATTISSVGINGNYAFGVAAIRVNVVSATATSIVIANFIQSVNSP